MSATVSIEEIIRQAFDKFHNEVQFGRIAMSDTMLTLINELEEECVSNAIGSHTTEAEMYFEEGERCGYERGHTDGYEQALDDYEVDV